MPTEFHRATAKAEAQAAREQAALLRELRRNVLAELARAQGFKVFHLQQLLRAIDRDVMFGSDMAQASAARAFNLAAQLGMDHVSAVAGIGAGPGVSRPLLQAVLEVTLDQERAVWSELRTKLKGQVRRVALGVDDPFTAMRQLSRALQDAKTFASYEDRAEFIIRTEVRRAFQIASNERSLQAGESLKVTGETLGKWWLTAGDKRVRADHVRAGIEYAKGKPIPMDALFRLGAKREGLRYPLDPRGSAKQVIGCRCDAIHVLMPKTKTAKARA